MSRLFTSTRGLCSWRDRLASPDKQWKRKYSAFETAVSWEAASSGVRYQMPHRCAAAVIEAKRLGAAHAAFVVQAFNTPETSFREFERFCSVLGIPAARGSLATTTANGISLTIGWTDCPLATDATIAACA
jgi:hypothetical protein